MIDFISADNATIQLFDGDNMVAAVKTAKSICYFLQEYGVAESVFASSSIDFASEYGFETDDAAMDLWLEGFKKFEMTKIN